MRKTSLLVALLLLCATIAYGLNSIAICPDHGVKATYTGNRKMQSKKWSCEYSHPTRLSDHKFWQDCD